MSEGTLYIIYFIFFIFLVYFATSILKYINIRQNNDKLILKKLDELLKNENKNNNDENRRIT